MYPPDLVISSSTVPTQNVGASAFITTSSTMAVATSIPTSTSGVLFQIATIATTSLPSLLALASSTSLLPASTTTMIDAASKNDPDNTGECQLLGPFAVLVQAGLGCLALLSLVYKRWRERPQRPVKVWAFDASKQVVGSALLHLANLFMAMFSTGQLEQTIAKAAVAAAAAIATGPGDDGYQPNPCSFYLLNLAIDTTIGIPILILILKILTVGASYTPIARPPESIQSGNYGSPPKTFWWIKQSFIYFFGLLGMKACVFLIFQLCPWIIEVGDWALRWTEGNEALQIAFVMLIFPLIMNALQYYIIDTFIKKATPADVEREDQEGDEDEEGGLLADEVEDEAEEVAAEEVKSKSHVKSRKSKRIKSYDPDKDGEIAGTPTGESSGSSLQTSEQDPVPKTLPGTGT